MYFANNKNYYNFKLWLALFISKFKFRNSTNSITKNSENFIERCIEYALS
jgi:hypothetical protein